MNLILIRFLIHRIKTNQNPDEFFPGRVGAYCIRPTNGHAGGRIDRKIAIFQAARVGAYCISPIDGHAGGRMDRKIAIFSGTRVGRNSIRPTNDHGRGRMNLIPIRFLIPRIKTNQNPDKFSSDRVGAYCIRPIDGHTGGRMDRKIAIF